MNIFEYSLKQTYSQLAKKVIFWINVWIFDEVNRTYNDCYAAFIFRSDFKNNLI